MAAQIMTNGSVPVIKYFLLQMITIVTFSGSCVAGENVDDSFLVQSESFLNSHPDLKYRAEALESYQKARYAEAYDYFRKAANFADKPSQAMIAEMYWKGLGMPEDRALAYAWMDLAAERRYADFIAFRELYWRDMTDAQRTQALAAGQQLYKKYGDDAAKTRLEKVLRRDRMNITGSRVGFVGTLKISVNGPFGQPISINGSEYYQDKFWQPEQYWKWQDTTWKALPLGRVEASDLIPIKPDPEKKDD